MATMGWYGVDLDATLATYDGWKGDFHIGAPIEPMVARVKKWLADGFTVKIVTARASEYDPTDRAEVVKVIQHIGQSLEVTNQKDYGMIELWDDRARQVMPNTGISMKEKYYKVRQRNYELMQRMIVLEGALRGLGPEGEQILKDLDNNG